MAFCRSAASVRLPKKRDTDMTQGNIVGHIIRFAFPLMLGNLFQQLYNTVDTWVVGNYVNNDAFAAVGAVAPIVNTLIGAFTGLSSGAGVVISQYYGARQMKKVEETVHTAITLTAILSVIFTAFGLLVTPAMLSLVKLNPAAEREAATYLYIYFAGIAGLMFYNMGAAILRAIGDSKRPFYFLVVCAILNTGLDLLFVLAFGMGVEGVALATVLSQAISAVLVIILLLKTNTCVKLQLRKLRVQIPIFKKILLVGIPAAFQLAVTAFSNVFVQSYIAYFDIGTDASHYMSGWTAFLKIDQLIFLPIQSVALAVTTFVGQNLGKGQLARAKKGVTRAVLISISASILMMIPIMIFAPSIVKFLNKEPKVVEYGTLLLRMLTPFYLLSCFNQVYASALRGAGNSKASMIIMLSSFVAFRQVYLFIMSRVCNEFMPIAMSYPAGWLMCSLLTAIYYFNTSLDKTRLVEDA